MVAELMSGFAENTVLERTSRAGSLVVGAVLDFLLPPRCIGCQARVSLPGNLCGVCWREMPFIAAPVCARYGTPFTHDIGEGGLSARALTDPPLFERLRAVATYQGIARDLALALKFNRRRDLAEPMGRWMVHAGRELISPDTVVMPVPLHRLRLLQRRFNQSADLARVIAREASIDWDPMLLRRARRTRQQVGLDSSERQKNVRGAFELRQGWSNTLHGRPVLLVDDVLTTGSTVTACTKVLRAAGASSVDVLTFAIAVGDEAHD
ncbi:ComF family protein [uncultured Roseibium sp.]|uniref:ComF family protein n=1 Tax=uncultured Roseibium sp. TaxID=1936171 RepID=UPI0025928719|nr:ComF family protein [uncultured Roseibium sp.]